MRLAPKQPRSRNTEKGRSNLGARRRRPANAAPRDLGDFLHDLVTDPEVQAAVKDYIVSGRDGAAQLFLEAAAYVIGRPKETVRLEVTPELVRLLSMASRGLASV